MIEALGYVNKLPNLFLKFGDDKKKINLLTKYAHTKYGHSALSCMFARCPYFCTGSSCRGIKFLVCLNILFLTYAYFEIRKIYFYLALN